jgi:hypothetical protein
MSTQNELVEALQSTGMLIRLSTSSFGTQVTDRVKSAEVTTDAHAASDAARVIINRLPGEAKIRHERVKKLLSQASAIIKENTTPWDESGYRLLMTSRFDEVMRYIVGVKESFDREVEALRSEADDIIAKAMQNLGDLADRVRPPSKDEMINAYQMRWTIMPVPDGANFKGVPDNTKKILSGIIARQVQKAYDSAVEDVADRVRPMMERVVEGLEKYEERLDKAAAGEEVGRAGTFRDTLVYNLRPVAELAKAMAAVNNDARLLQIAEKADAILSIEPKVLRTDADARETAKKEAGELIAFFDSWTVPAQS